MITNWSRRALFASVGVASLAGCLNMSNDSSTDDQHDDDRPIGERPADDLPDDCPKSTLADYDLPDDLSKDTVETFVIEYHKEYVLNEMFSPTHQSDSVGGTVTSIDHHEYGYVIVVEWDGADYSDVTEFEAEPATDPPDSDLPSVETLDSKILREYAIEAAEQHGRVGDVSGPDWDLDQMRQDLEPLPGNEDDPSDPKNLVRYIRVDDTPVRLHLFSYQMHGDYFGMSTRYYVDSHVVRQSDEYSASDDDTDPLQLPLLECQP